MQTSSDASVAEAQVTLPADVDLHARPAADFVRTAMRFSANVWVGAGEREVDAKSLLSILALGAKRGYAACAYAPRARTRRPRSTRSAATRRRAARVAPSGRPRADARPRSAPRPRRPRVHRQRAAAEPRDLAAPSSRRIQPRTAPTRAAPTLSSSTPKPDEQRQHRPGPTPPRRRPRSGSPASCAALDAARDRGQHARDRGRARRSAAKRSAPRVAAVRSLVPMLRKSAAAAIAGGVPRRGRGLDHRPQRRACARVPSDRARPARSAPATPSTCSGSRPSAAGSARRARARGEHDRAQLSDRTRSRVGEQQLDAPLRRCRAGTAGDLSAPKSSTRTIAGADPSPARIGSRASACSRSLGQSTASRNASSVRSRPIPSAPARRPTSSSVGAGDVGQHGDRAGRRVVTAGRSRIGARRARRCAARGAHRRCRGRARSRRRARRQRAGAAVEHHGGRRREPRAPRAPRPVTIGIPSERATIAACAVAPPPASATPASAGASSATSAGPRSCAIRITPERRRRPAASVRGRPPSKRAARRPRLRTSSARAASVSSAERRDRVGVRAGGGRIACGARQARRRGSPVSTAADQRRDRRPSAPRSRRSRPRSGQAVGQRIEISASRCAQRRERGVALWLALAPARPDAGARGMALGDHAGPMARHPGSRARAPAAARATISPTWRDLRRRPPAQRGRG